MFRAKILLVVATPRSDLLLGVGGRPAGISLRNQERELSCCGDGSRFFFWIDQPERRRYHSIMETTNAIDQLWTVKEASKHFGVTDSYIRRLCLEHRIGHKIGRDRLLTDNDVLDLRKVLPNA